MNKYPVNIPPPLETMRSKNQLSYQHSPKNGSIYLKVTSKNSSKVAIIKHNFTSQTAKKMKNQPK